MYFFFFLTCPCGLVLSLDYRTKWELLSDAGFFLNQVLQIQSQTLKMICFKRTNDKGVLKIISNPGFVTFPVTISGSEGGRRRSREEDEEELQKRRQLQEEHLTRVTSNMDRNNKNTS